MLTINESLLRELSKLKFPFQAEAQNRGNGYVISITCKHMHIENQLLQTSRGEVRIFKTFENLEKVCKSFGVNKITVL